MANKTDKQYVLVHWYLQQHGSFSSGGRSRDIILTEFPSTEQLRDYLFRYIKENYPYVDMSNQQFSVTDLCRIAIDESDKLLATNRHEIPRVTSRHIWPPNHKLLMGCLVNAHIVATHHDQFAEHQRVQSDEQDNDDTTYCLITQLGNHPTHVKFLRGTHALREEIRQRFSRHCQTLSIQKFCDYVTSQHWRHLDDYSLYGFLVDFIIAGEPLLFTEHKE